MLNNYTCINNLFSYHLTEAHLSVLPAHCQCHTPDRWKWRRCILDHQQLLQNVQTSLPQFCVYVGKLIALLLTVWLNTYSYASLHCL